MRPSQLGVTISGPYRGGKARCAWGAVEQIWNSFFWGVRQLFIDAVSPFVALSRAAGLDLNAAQIWMVFFTLPFVGYAAYFLYVELTLSHRGRRVVGSVIGIDPGDESPDRPIIEFRDHAGSKVVFTSHLGVNATTGTLGAKVDILFDPLHPKHAREVGRSWAKAGYLVFLAVFIGLMIFGTVMAKYAIY